MSIKKCCAACPDQYWATDADDMQIKNNIRLSK